MKYHIMLALRVVTDKQLAEVAVRLADVPEVTSTFERILIEVMSGTVMNPIDTLSFVVPNTGNIVYFSKNQMNELHATAGAGNKIAGIKLIRLVTNLGLKEAKDLWEMMEETKIIDFNREASNIRRY